ncbi:hypothetical protein BA768_13745 [Chryseobacterium sp. CBo1]|nr:hypothetical protein BA768_13745 [Chryseobacterium sp. CBo1]
MKSLKLYQFFLFVVIFFNTNAQTFKIYHNEILLNTVNVFKPASRIEMISSLKFKNEYYSIFQESELYYLGHSQNYLVKFDNNGNILLVIKLPEKLSNSYLDFFELNDKLYVQDQDNSRYVFDFVMNKFLETSKGNDLVYENTNYKVFYKSFGEWGEATWFINKKDKSEYFTSKDGKDVNFLNGKFYITNLSSIWEIENPRKLDKCEPDQYYDVINNKKFGMFTSYDNDKGINLIFKDTVVYDSYDPGTPVGSLNYAFVTSFVTNDKLFQITQLKDKTAITRINNGNVEVVYKFDEKYNFFSWRNQFRNTENSNKFLKFRNGYNSFGFFEAEREDVNITKVQFEYDTLQYVKSDNIVSLISILAQRNEVSKNDIVGFEKSTKGTDLLKYKSNINHNYYYPRKYKDVNVQTINFLKSENEILTQNIDYLFTKKDEQLRAIYIDYDQTLYNNTVGKNYFPIRNNNVDLSDEKFKEKHKEIREKLNEIGQQIVVKPRENKGTYESWIINGWRFNLYKIKPKDIYGVTLLICREEDFNEND